MTEQPKHPVDPTDPIRNSPEEIRRIIMQVLQLEKDRLYEEKPKLNSDILDIIKKEIR